MAPRRRTPIQSTGDTQSEQLPLTPTTPTAIVSFSDEQFKRLLNAIAAKSVPPPLKTLQVNFSPHLHDVFTFTSQLTDDVDPKRVHECLQHEAKYWYDSLSQCLKAGLAARTSNWIDMLETKFRWTAGKASVDISVDTSVIPPQEQQEQGKHDTKHDTQTASTSAQPNHPQITMQPPEQDAPGSDTLDTQHDTQKPSTPAHPNPQPNTVQTPEQRAPSATTPERFKQEVDYKYDGPCIMRHRKKLSLNTVKFMMSTPSHYLIQLQYQARGGSHFAYYWSNSRPPGLLSLTHHPPRFERTLTRLNIGHHGNRHRLSHSGPSNPRQFSGTWFRHFSSSVSQHARTTHAHFSTTTLHISFLSILGPSPTLPLRPKLCIWCCSIGGLLLGQEHFLLVGNC